MSSSHCRRSGSACACQRAIDQLPRLRQAAPNEPRPPCTARRFDRPVPVRRCRRTTAARTSGCRDRLRAGRATPAMPHSADGPLMCMPASSARLRSTSRAVDGSTRRRSFPRVAHPRTGGPSRAAGSGPRGPRRPRAPPAICRRADRHPAQPIADHRRCDRGRGRKCEATGEHRQACEHRLFRAGEKIVAPVQRRVERSMTCRASRSIENAELLIERSKNGARRASLRFEPPRARSPTADHRDGGRSLPPMRLRLRAHRGSPTCGLGTLDEELHRCAPVERDTTVVVAIRYGEWQEPLDGLARHIERLATGGENADPVASREHAQRDLGGRSRRCSQLSRTISASRLRRYSISAGIVRGASAPRAPRAAPTAGTTCEASRSGARSTNHTPSAMTVDQRRREFEREACLADTPAPTRVTRRADAS